MILKQIAISLFRSTHPSDPLFRTVRSNGIPILRSLLLWRRTGSMLPLRLCVEKETETELLFLAFSVALWRIAYPNSPIFDSFGKFFFFFLLSTCSSAPDRFSSVLHFSGIEVANLSAPIDHADGEAQSRHSGKRGPSWRFWIVRTRSVSSVWMLRLHSKP